MTRHVEAAFTHDRNSRLLTINEPWDGTVPAPRFFLGRTIDGKIVKRYRRDMADTVIGQLDALARDEKPALHFEEPPRHQREYLDLLAGETFSMGPCFFIPPGKLKKVPNFKLIRVNGENIGNYSSIDGFQWLSDEIDLVQPCTALIDGDRIVSLCRSVRISAEAHEAGLETLPDYRGRGFALAVTRAWAEAVREKGALPLYSTSWKNSASQRVALKLKLFYYGNSFSVT